jgi:hypothetical protein
MTQFSRCPNARYLTAIVGAAALSWSAMSLADHHGHHGSKFPISIAEAEAAAQARFAEMDTDGDGQISRSEFAQAPMQRHQGGWSQRHKLGVKGAGDGSGYRRGPEGRKAEGRGEHWQARREAMQEETDAELFARLDEDGDGQLSEAEFSARAVKSARHEMMRERLFDRLDTDGSGTLTRDELPNPVDRLEAMDADGDGIVTQEEARAFYRARRGSDG